jgi:diadenylate cyclase
MDQILSHWLFKNWIIPIVDVAILSWLIYRTYRILFQTKSIALLRGMAYILVIYALSVLLRLETLNWILNLLAPGLFIGLAILFQPEFRKIFTQFGQGGLFATTTTTKIPEIDAIISTVEYLSGRHFGAIIVFARRVGLKDYYGKQGTQLHAELSSNLLTTIFFKDSPLHDGAVIIEGDKITAAGVLLPLTEQPDIQKQFGTRHRAALGMAEETDAVVLVVSEESGAVSLAYNGALYYGLSLKEVRQRLTKLLQNQSLDEWEEEVVQISQP